MKKSLLSLSLLVGMAAGLQAQQRLVLYEEFTGENCPPCAATNPGLEALMKAGDNPNKIIMIKYQVPIPTAGPIYTELPTHSNNRRSYYGVSSAPNARMDGAYSPGGDGSGHPAYLTQAHIDARYAVESPFNITFSDVNITTSGVSATITVQAVSAGTYTNLKLRAALVETMDFETPPGTNGETHFVNVVRNMYPDANGQDATNVWTAGQTETYTISGSFPSSVYSSIENEHFLVVWLQDDADKSVLQAARSDYPEIEVRSEGLTMDGALKCGTPNTFNPVVTVSNGGTETINSLTVYYKEQGAATWSTYNWTGSLAPHSSVDIALPEMVVTSVGQIVIVDSLGNPNGSVDKFKNNNRSSASVPVLQNTDGAFPIVSNFEPGSPYFTPYSVGGSGYPIEVYKIDGRGYDGSNHMLVYPCYNLGPGTTGFSILPFANLPSGAKALDFYVAYCQYSSENDKLEVVYSTDCGATWTSVWSKQGSALATKGPQTGSFIPTSNSQWRLYSADLSSVPNGAQIAFRATSQYGNNMFIDNVNLRSGPSSIEDIIQTSSLEVYPNPVSQTLNIRFNALNSFEGKFVITNIAGQVVYQSTENIVAGENLISIDASGFAAGNYLISIGDGENATVTKFVKQ